MKKSFKSMIGILLVFALLVGAVGCTTTPEPAATPAPATQAPQQPDGEDQETPTEPTEPSDEPIAATPSIDEEVELRVLNYLNMSAPGYLEELKVVWEAFEQAHPNIKINREDAYEESYHQKTEAYAANDSLPDVMYAWPSGRSTTLHTNRLLKDLKPLIDRDGLANYYIPLALDPTEQVANYTAILSLGVSATNAFYINKEVLDAVGLTPARTYSELVSQVPVLQAAGYETILMANQANWVMQSCLYSLVVGRFMGENWHEQIHNGERDFSDPDFIASLAFIKQMYDDGVLAQSTLAVDYGEAAGLFANNQAAYYIDGDWRVGDFLTDKETGEFLIDPERQNNFEITVFPEIDVPGVKFNRSNSSVLGVGWGMNANIEPGSVKEEAAWTLIKWLAGRETQTYMIEAGGLATPSRSDIDYSTMDLEPLQVAMANLGNEFDRSTVVVDGVFEGPVYTPLNDGLQALARGSQTPEEVASIVQAAYDAWKETQ